MNTVIRPIIPYRGPIPGRLHEGKRIKIRGHAAYGADRFTINLQTGLDPNSDRPLHISVRFGGNVVVRNTLLQNSWGSEERSGPFPFSVGQNFTMSICVTHTTYKISVGGQHCWEYTHRIPYPRVSSILIDGDAQIERIEYINAFPIQRPAACSSISTPVCTSSPGFNIPVCYSTILSCLNSASTYFHRTFLQLQPLPCIFPIYGGIRPGMSIYISGRSSENPHKFTINLQNGTATFPPPDIAFHFDVRFFNNSIVRNSRTNNAWAVEETMISYFPFRPGGNFDIIIRVQSDSYVVSVNGQHFISFRHRLGAFSCINTLFIENDVIVSSIKYT